MHTKKESIIANTLIFTFILFRYNNISLDYLNVITLYMYIHVDLSG